MQVVGRLTSHSSGPADAGRLTPALSYLGSLGLKTSSRFWLCAVSCFHCRSWRARQGKALSIGTVPPQSGWPLRARVQVRLSATFLRQVQFRLIVGCFRPPGWVGCSYRISHAQGRPTAFNWVVFGRYLVGAVLNRAVT